MIMSTKTIKKNERTQKREIDTRRGWELRSQMIF